MNLVPDPHTAREAPDAVDAVDAAAALLADDRLTVVGLLAEAFAALEARSSAQLGGHGLSGVEFEVLLRLARSPLGLLRMSDLSAQTTLTSSGVTRVVDRLVDRGLVARQACATDRRTTYAVVTEAGRSLLAEVLPGHLALIETTLLEPLRRGGTEELDAFVAALRRLRDHLAPCSTVGSEGPLPQQPAAVDAARLDTPGQQSQASQAVR